MTDILREKLYKIPGKCLKCSTKYAKNNIDILSEEANLLIFHLTCHSCKTSILFHVVFGKEGILSVGTLTDVGKEDLEKLRLGKLISVNDVIEAYRELNGKLKMEN